jgi:pimeloyl-ACP methyl ester carboxylesterase
MSINRSIVRAACAVAVVLCAAVSSAPRAGSAGEQKTRAGRSRFAKFENMRVHYTDAGKGDEALVFVHGWACNLDFWRMQAPAFAAKSRVIAVDLPGHGESDKPQQVAYTMDLFARAVEAVMRDAGVKRAVLVGHSMGTPVVRQFYRRFPDKTLALVSVDGALRPFAPRAMMEQFIAPLRGGGYREGSARMVEGMLQPVKSEALRAEIKAAMLATPAHVGLGAMEAMMDESIYKEDPIRVPLLAVLARSPFWAADNEQFFRKLAPDLDYRMWDGVSHFLMMEKPDEFNRALAEFLAARRLLAKK